MEKRSPNFTTTEIEYLLDAVKKYKNIIENKKTDRVGAEEKLKAWKNIEREYNSTFTHTFRTHKVLKTKYGNIKATAKQNFAFDKRQTYATGGGPPLPSTTTTTDRTILEICQESQILGQKSNYDCDACKDAIEYLDEFLEESEAGGNMVETDVGVKEEVHDDSSWVKYTPKMLKKPLSRPLKQAKSHDNWAKLSELKVEKQTMEIEFLREKYRLELEKLNLEIKILKSS